MIHCKGNIFGSKLQLRNIWGNFRSCAFKWDWVFLREDAMKIHPYLVFSQIPLGKKPILACLFSHHHNVVPFYVDPIDLL